MQHPVLILWTCESKTVAKEMAEKLLQKKLIACASIFPVVESLFHWNGKIDHAQECKVFFKTQSLHFFAIREVILSNSSYEVPEILQIPVEQGHSDYLTWLMKETRTGV